MILSLLHWDLLGFFTELRLALTVLALIVIAGVIIAYAPTLRLKVAISAPFIFLAFVLSGYYVGFNAAKAQSRDAEELAKANRVIAARDERIEEQTRNLQALRRDAEATAERERRALEETSTLQMQLGEYERANNALKDHHTGVCILTRDDARRLQQIGAGGRGQKR